MGDLLGLGGYSSGDDDAEDGSETTDKGPQNEDALIIERNSLSSLSKQRSPGLSGLLGYEAPDDLQDDTRTDQDLGAAQDTNSISPGLFVGTVGHNGLAGLWSSASRNGNAKDEGTPTGQLGQGTPTGIRLRNPALRIISKSATPICSSPVLAGQVSDAEEATSDTENHTVASTGPPQVLTTITLPPAPNVECHAQIRKNVERCAGLRADKGIRVNDDLRDKKEFRNPGILELLMDKYHIRETGSNYPPEIFNPTGYSSGMYYDALRKQQNERDRRREESKVGRSAVEFVSSSQAAASRDGGVGGSRPVVQHISVPAREPTKPADAAAAAPSATTAAANGAPASQRERAGGGADGPSATAGGGGGDGDGEKPKKRSKWDQALRDAAEGSAGAAPVPQPPTTAAVATNLVASTGVAHVDMKRMQLLQQLQQIQLQHQLQQQLQSRR